MTKSQNFQNSDIFTFLFQNSAESLYNKFCFYQIFMFFLVSAAKTVVYLNFHVFFSFLQRKLRFFVKKRTNISRDLVGLACKLFFGTRKNTSYKEILHYFEIKMSKCQNFENSVIWSILKRPFFHNLPGRKHFNCPKWSIFVDFDQFLLEGLRSQKKKKPKILFEMFE